MRYFVTETTNSQMSASHHFQTLAAGKADTENGRAATNPVADVSLAAPATRL